MSETTIISETKSINTKKKRRNQTSLFLILKQKLISLSIVEKTYNLLP